MFEYYTIQSDSNYKLSALVVEDGYDLPSLVKYSTDYYVRELLLEIDNPYYITKTLLPKLQQNRKMSEKQVVLGIPLKEIPEVIELIKRGIQLGFFDKYKHNKKDEKLFKKEVG